MLTGDGRVTAEAVARELGIDEVIADLSPEGKADAVTRLRREGRRAEDAGQDGALRRGRWAHGRGGRRC